MLSDSTPDGPTPLLLALQATGDPNTLRVVAIYRVTAEQEALDDISDTFIPGPGAIAAFAAAAKEPSILTKTHRGGLFRSRPRVVQWT